FLLGLHHRELRFRLTKGASTASIALFSSPQDSICISGGILWNLSNMRKANTNLGLMRMSQRPYLHRSIQTKSNKS
ncbi:unnamed protein product, partial [Brassica oleracea var. botrytis]